MNLPGEGTADNADLTRSATGISTHEPSTVIPASDKQRKEFLSGANIGSKSISEISANPAPTTEATGIARDITAETAIKANAAAEAVKSVAETVVPAIQTADPAAPEAAQEPKTNEQQLEELRQKMKQAEEARAAQKPPVITPDEAVAGINPDRLKLVQDLKKSQ